MTILSKKEMSEEDIKLNFITPAILSKWDKDRITMETKITDGMICLNGNFVHRDKKSTKYADYVLYWNSSFPIAIVEAKDNKHSVSFGLQQAITYAQMMDVPFVYSSNGDAFYEHDMLTGTEREVSLDDFPTLDDLIKRYKTNANGGKGLSENELAVINQPYYSSQKTYEPRYYQRVAVNRTVDAIARYGYRNRQNIYGISNRVPSVKKQYEAKNTLSCGQEYSC